MPPFLAFRQWSRRNLPRWRAPLSHLRKALGRIQSSMISRNTGLRRAISPRSSGGAPSMAHCTRARAAQVSASPEVRQARTLASSLNSGSAACSNCVSARSQASESPRIRPTRQWDSSRYPGFRNSTAMRSASSACSVARAVSPRFLSRTARASWMRRRRAARRRQACSRVAPTRRNATGRTRRLRRACGRRRPS